MRDSKSSRMPSRWLKSKVQNSIRILGVRVDHVTCDDALARVEEYLCGGSCHQIATVNPEFVVLAQSNAELRRVLNSTDLNVPDGVGLLWASRRLGQPLPERVTGQELVDRIAAMAAQFGHRVFMLGAREGIAERAASELQRRHPGLVVAGCFAGSPAAEEDEAVVRKIIQAGARILFVAYGPPKQEFWIVRNAPRLAGQVAVAMGVGGTFDTLAGIVPRAPRWMQQAGLEWTYRLAREPHRFRRQLAIPSFMWLVIKGGRSRE